MIVEFLFGFLVVLLVLDYCNKRGREEFFKKAGIKGPKPWPIFGNILSTRRNTTSQIFNFIKNLTDRHGKVFRFWLLSECVLFVQDAKYFENILSSQILIRKSIAYDLLRSWLGDGLLMSYATKWHSRRKIITPTYHFKILEEFVQVFDTQSSVMVERLKDKADGKTVVNMTPVVCLTALDIIAETAMGVKINAQKNPNFPYTTAVMNVTDIISDRFVRPILRYEFTFKLTQYSRYRLMKNSVKSMRNFTHCVIRGRRAALEKTIKGGDFGAASNEADDDLGIKKRSVFLDVLLQSTIDGKSLTNEDIREEVATFMFEGHDTTTSAISHTLYLLARHPAVQQKVFEEILQIIGCDKDKPVATMKELQDLKYLEAVIKESLRLYPPVPIIARITEQNVEIDGKIIPANVNVLLLIYAACRDPDYFANPNDFIPERFINGGGDWENVNPFAYVPFSAGPRNCIGQKFAILEMKSTISKMIRYFELLPLGEDVVPVMNLILRSATGTNLGLRPRIY